MAAINLNGEELLSVEGWKHVFQAWCEANPAIVNSTVKQAEQRLKALEEFWRAWKAICDSKGGYDKRMPEAVKAVGRSDKALLAGANEPDP